jgi:membrane-bound lytic murein transglycosylase A
MNVGLTAQRSAAIDPERVPFGYPIWMDTTLPDGNEPYQRLLMSQDKGAAIKGLRVDIYFGSGHAAGETAGKMKQTGRVWLLVPIESADSNAGSATTTMTRAN